jgi:hypothetical protein
MGGAQHSLALLTRQIRFVRYAVRATEPVVDTFETSRRFRRRSAFGSKAEVADIPPNRRD